MLDNSILRNNLPRNAVIIIIIRRILELETVIYVCGKHPRRCLNGHGLQIICWFLALQNYNDLKTRKIECKCDRRKNYGPKASFLVFQNPAIRLLTYWCSRGANSIKLHCKLSQSEMNYNARRTLNLEIQYTRTIDSVLQF